MKHIKISRHILFLCALTLAVTPALGARAYDDNAVVGTTEAVAMKDIALEQDSATDAPVLKPRKSRSLVTYVRHSNVLGSSAVGFVSGLVGSGVLLIKDATVGIVIPGGPQYWGRARVLPLTLLVLASTFGGGIVGYYNDLNLLDVF